MSERCPARSKTNRACTLTKGHDGACFCDVVMPLDPPSRHADLVKEIKRAMDDCNDPFMWGTLRRCHDALSHERL